MRLPSLLRSASLAALVTAASLLVPGADPARAQPSEPEAPEPGLPVPEDSEFGIVHSWALAPAGAGDGSQAGDRANLTYEMAPGTVVTDRVELFNFSNVALTFELQARDAVNNADGDFAPVLDRDEQTGVGAWIDLPVETLTIPAGRSATFDIVVNVPVDARPGDHAGVILASSDARGTGADGRIVNLERSTGTRVYIRVDGELRPELAVAGLGSGYAPGLDPLGGTAEVTYRIENRGNVRLAATHQVSVAGPFGLLRSSGPRRELPELLPGESVELTEVVDAAPATGLLFADVDIEPVTIDGTEDEVVANDRTSVSLAPPVLPLALAVAAALALVARARFRRHARRELAAEHVVP